MDDIISRKQTRLTLYLRMQRFIYSEIHQREILGRNMDCLSIPLELNGMELTQKGVLLKLALTPLSSNELSQSHFASVVFPKRLEETKALIQKLGFGHNLLYLGNAYESYTYYNKKKEYKGESVQSIFGLDKPLKYGKKDDE